SRHTPRRALEGINKELKHGYHARQAEPVVSVQRIKRERLGAVMGGQDRDECAFAEFFANHEFVHAHDPGSHEGEL
ncbi:MAG: hypothetical protein V7640_1135, partial [Betaproteobacteria bacterium]